MKTIAFMRSTKDGERRLALLPSELKLIQERIQAEQLPYKFLLAKNYGQSLYLSDQDYQAYGAQICPLEDLLAADIIVDVKLGDASYLDQLKADTIIFGWAHAALNQEFTRQVVANQLTVYAWENLYKSGRYLFYRNRNIAGQAAIMHAYLELGKMPYETKVALLGEGKTARGALRVLYGLGADVTVFNELQNDLFRQTFDQFDVIVNCVLWDPTNPDRLLNREDLQKMKPGSMIIDVACNNGLEIETSQARPISDPTYEIDGVIHYAVDNTPALFPYQVSKDLSEGLWPYYLELLKGQISPELLECKIIQSGKILDPEIRDLFVTQGL